MKKIIITMLSIILLLSILLAVGIITNGFKIINKKPVNEASTENYIMLANSSKVNSNRYSEIAGKNIAFTNLVPNSKLKETKFTFTKDFYLSEYNYEDIKLEFNMPTKNNPKDYVEIKLDKENNLVEYICKKPFDNQILIFGKYKSSNEYKFVNTIDYVAYEIFDTLKSKNFNLKKIDSYNYTIDIHELDFDKIKNQEEFKNGDYYSKHFSSTLRNLMTSFSFPIFDYDVKLTSNIYTKLIKLNIYELQALLQNLDHIPIEFLNFSNYQGIDPEFNQRPNYIFIDMINKNSPKYYDIKNCFVDCYLAINYSNEYLDELKKVQLIKIKNNFIEHK